MSPPRLKKPGILCPVVPDTDFAVWKGDGVRAWPARVRVDGRAARPLVGRTETL